jgi:ectoine hydroxylase-related dioxygenase (phytanoyl-CoA dioxygenase family)
MIGQQPPVRSTDLSRDEIGRFWRDGYLTLGRLLGEDHVAELRQFLDHHLRAEGHADLPQGVDKLDLGVADEGAAASLTVVIDLCRQHPLFRAVGQDPRLCLWAAQLLECSDAALLSDEILIKPPRIGSAINWHQDWPVYPTESSHYLTFWVPLVNVANDNGAMEMVVGSHGRGRFLPAEFRDGVVPDPRLLDLEASGMQPLPDPAQTALRIEMVHLRAGECSVHHALTWHRSVPNTASAYRYAIAQRYRCAEHGHMEEQP